MLVKYENHSEIFFETLHLKFEQGISRLGQRFYPQPQPVINILIHVVFIYFLCVLCSEHTAVGGYHDMALQTSKPLSLTLVRGSLNILYLNRNISNLKTGQVK